MHKVEKEKREVDREKEQTKEKVEGENEGNGNTIAEPKSAHSPGGMKQKLRRIGAEPSI